MTSIYQTYVNNCSNELNNVINALAGKYDFDADEAMKFINNGEIGEIRRFRVPKKVTKKVSKEEKEAAKAAKDAKAAEKKAARKATKAAQKAAVERARPSRHQLFNCRRPCDQPPSGNADQAVQSCYRGCAARQLLRRVGRANHHNSSFIYLQD